MRDHFFEYQVRTEKAAIAFRFSEDGPMVDILNEERAIRAAQFQKTRVPETDLYILKRQVIDGTPQRWETYS